MNIRNDEKETQQKDSIGKFTGFFLFRNLINGYNEAKDSPDEERYKIKKYGVISIILAIIALVISVSCLLCSVTGVDFWGFSYVVMLLIFIIGGVIISALLSIYSFIFAVMQVRLNRRASGIIGIVLSVLSVVSSILLVVFMIL